MLIRDKSGVSIVMVLIVSFVVAITMLTALSYMSIGMQNQKYQKARRARDMVADMVKRAVNTKGAVLNSLYGCGPTMSPPYSTNLAARHCVGGSPTGAPIANYCAPPAGSPANDFVLLTADLTNGCTMLRAGNAPGWISQPGSRTTNSGRTQLYNLSGDACSAPGPNCIIGVTTTWTATCTAPCYYANTFTINYIVQLVRSSDGTPLQLNTGTGASLGSYTGTDIAEIKAISGSRTWNVCNPATDPLRTGPPWCP